MSMLLNRNERKILLAGLNKLDESLFNPTSEMCGNWRRDIAKVKSILLSIGSNDFDILDRTVIVSPTEKMNGHEIGDELKLGLGDRPHHSDCEICQAYVYFNSYSEEKVWAILRDLGLEDNAKVITVKDPFYPQIYNWPSAQRYWNNVIEKYLRADAPLVVDG